MTNTVLGMILQLLLILLQQHLYLWLLWLNRLNYILLHRLVLQSATDSRHAFRVAMILECCRSNMASLHACLVTQSCLTLCHPVDWARQALLSMGILQVRILEWVAMPSSRGSSQLRDQTWVSHIAGGFFFTVWVTREAQRILEWIAYPFSRGSFQPRNWTGVSCIAGRFFTSWATREAKILNDPYIQELLDAILFTCCFY